MKARRQRQRASVRTTRRVQRGGFSWNEMRTSIHASTVADWQDFFAKDAANSALFGAVLDKKGTVAAAAAPTKEQLEGWLNCIMYQDTLIDFAFDKFIASNNTEYLKDVVRFINREYDDKMESKFHKLLALKATDTDETGMSTTIFKYFPDSFHNSFITSLAIIINFIEKHPDQLTSVDTPALARYFKSITSSNAYKLTGSNSDEGFYMGMPIQTFKEFYGDKNEFYEIIVGDLKNLMGKDESAIATYATEIIAGAKSSDLGEIHKWCILIWRKLTVLVAILHIKGKLNTLLTYFNSPRTNAVGELLEFTHIPNEPELQTPVGSTINVLDIAKTLTVGTIATRILTKRGTTYTTGALRGGARTGATEHSGWVPGTSCLEFVIYLAKRLKEQASVPEVDDKGVVKTPIPPPFIPSTFSEFFKAS